MSPGAGRLAGLLEEGLSEGLFPGVGAIVLEGERLLDEAYLGTARLGTGGTTGSTEAAATGSTLWDLASLTKPLAGAALALLLDADRSLSLDDPIARFSDLYRKTGFDGVTLRLLLLHAAGLPAWTPCYVRGEGRTAYRRTLAALDLEAKPGSAVTYSCLGYLLLADVLETVASAPVDVQFRDRIAVPLGVAGDLLFLPPDGSDSARAAGGEEGDATERRMVAELGLSYAGFRQGVVNGEVNDGNAWRRGAGVSLNAGLFGTVRAVARAARAWLEEGGGVLPGGAVAEALRAATPDGSPRRGLGWQLASEENAAGAALPPSAFGHTGFTGASVFCDPERGRVAVLLGNRLHGLRGEGAAAGGTPPDLNPFRRRFHALAASL